MWLKKIRKKKMQSIIIILIVMLCSALMTSSLVIMTSWQKPYKQLQQECNCEKVRIYLSQDTKEAADMMQKKFMALEKVSQTQAVVYSSLGSTVKTAQGESIDGFVDLTQMGSENTGNLKCIAGDLTDLSETECLLSAAIANIYDIQVGDWVDTGNGGSYIVKGIYTNPFNMSFWFENEMFVKQLPEDGRSEYYINVYSKEDLSGDDLIDLYREKNDGIVEGRAITLESRISNNQMTEQIFGAILLVMSILILIVSGIMIRYLIKNTMLSDRNSIAVYKTLGYTNHDINGIYMKMYLLLVLTGSILGVVISVFISNSFTRTTYQNLGISKSGGTLQVGIWCVSAITLYVFLQVYLVIRKIKDIKPIEVFRGTVKAKIRSRKKSRKFISFSPFHMAARMISNEKRNTVIILITCMMAVYCVNFGATVIDVIGGMKNENYYWIGFDKHDVSVETDSSKYFAEQVDKLKNEPEVARLIKTTSDIPCALPWKKGMGDTAVASMVYETYEGIEMPTVTGRNPKYPNEIAIGGLVADKLGKSVGDYMDIYINGEKTTLLICGTFQCYYNMGKSCRLLEETLTDVGVAVSYREASIYLKEGTKVSDFVAKCSDKYNEELKIFPREQKYEAILNMMNAPQMVALKPFIGMVLFLGGLNIAAIIYLKNKDYSKVYSTYKAIGYSTGHLMLTNMFYVGILGITTVLVTVPLFIVCFPLTMVLSMSIFGFKEYPVIYNIKTILWSNGLTIAVFVFCGIISSINLYKNSIEDLTEE